jgi:hypothetical protein
VAQRFTAALADNKEWKSGASAPRQDDPKDLYQVALFRRAELDSHQ